MKKFNLEPNVAQKSFYGKAVVIEKDNGEAVLQSYGTDVCSVDALGRFRRHWSGWSATTQKHVNAFLALYGIRGGGKSWWMEQPVERFGWVGFYLARPAGRTA